MGVNNPLEFLPRCGQSRRKRRSERLNRSTATRRSAMSNSSCWSRHNGRPSRSNWPVGGWGRPASGHRAANNGTGRHCVWCAVWWHWPCKSESASRWNWQRCLARSSIRRVDTWQPSGRCTASPSNNHQHPIPADWTWLNRLPLDPLDAHNICLWTAVSPKVQRSLKGWKRDLQPISFLFQIFCFFGVGGGEQTALLSGRTATDWRPKVDKLGSGASHLATSSLVSPEAPEENGPRILKHINCLRSVRAARVNQRNGGMRLFIWRWPCQWFLVTTFKRTSIFKFWVISLTAGFVQSSSTP